MPQETVDKYDDCPVSADDKAALSDLSSKMSEN